MRQRRSCQAAKEVFVLENSTRSSFSGKLGFVLAAAGSAVGLGNIWRFPYLAAKYGGGMFLLVYLILVLTVGFTLVLAETAIGRKTGQSAIGAFSALNRKAGFLGVLNSVVPMLILPYYCVIGGWVIKYLITFAGGASANAAGTGFFSAFVSKPVEPILWLALFLGVTVLIVLGGVEKGIEKVSKWMMPALIVLSVIIAVYSITRPGALEGVKYYLLPDFSHFSIMTVVAALGQMFFSLSIAMGILIAYGSYMPKNIDMVKSVHQVELFDTSIAIIAGLMVVPAVFAFSGGEAAVGAGPSLMFETLPKVFESMGAGGIIGFIFFLLILCAALTSSIALLEAVAVTFQDKFHWSRKKSTLLCALGIFALALPVTLGYSTLSDFRILGFDMLDLFDFLSNSVLMPVAAFLTCIFITRVCGVKTIIDEVKLSSPFKGERTFTIFIKYLAPICTLAIFVTQMLSAFGVIKI